MATTGTGEANAALLTAGLGMIAVGAVLAAFPAGRVLGVGIAFVGSVVFVVFTVRAWRDVRSRPRRADSRQKDPYRFRNAEERLMALMGSFAGATIGTIVLTILNPSEDRSGLLWITVPVLIAAAIAFLLVRRRNRRRDAGI